MLFAKHYTENATLHTHGESSGVAKIHRLYDSYKSN